MQNTGLTRKYEVRRLNDVGDKHGTCRYFVLDPEHDPLAAEALAHYSKIAWLAGYEELANDLDHWLAHLDGDR